jgi:predicted ATPase
MTWFGDFVAGCDHIDKALALESEITEEVNLSIGADARVFGRAFGCHAHWHIGKFERAAKLSEEGIARARAIEEPFTLAIALNYAAMLHQFDYNNLVAQKLTEEVIELCTEHQFAYYLAWARIIHGWTTICAGDNGVGLAEIRTGLDDFEETGAGLRLPYYLSLLADGQRRDGQPEKALDTVDLALQRANTNGEKWHNADLFRLKAQLLLQMNPGKIGDAETAFQEALNIAREQGCKARELQITTELGRLWQSHGKQREAHDLVAPIYGCFPSSSNSVCVKNAKALLEELK